MIATRSIFGFRNKSTDQKCPFDLGNGIIPADKIIRKARYGYLVKEYSQAVPGTYQIVPVWHDLGVVRWLLFLWSFFWLVRRYRRDIHHGDFNLSINFGPRAGQTVLHPHVWIIPRHDDGGKGLAFYVALEATCREATGTTLADMAKSCTG